MGNQRARSRGLRHGTRNMFSRPFRKKGALNSTTFLRTFRVRDFPHPAFALRKRPPARHKTPQASVQDVRWFPEAHAAVSHAFAFPCNRVPTPHKLRDLGEHRS